MIYLLALLPATALAIAGYLALFLSARCAGGMQTFGKLLGFWAFTLAALVILGALFAAAIIATTACAAGCIVPGRTSLTRARARRERRRRSRALYRRPRRPRPIDRHSRASRQRRRVYSAPQYGHFAQPPPSSMAKYTRGCEFHRYICGIGQHNGRSSTPTS